MASPIGSHGTFNVKTDRRGSTVPVHISEQAGARAENLSLSTWGASFVLANVLHELAVSLPKGNEAPASGTHVLELGAGTGLVGLTAAMLWKMPTLLTDLSPLLPALAGNVLLNKALLARQSVSCASLDWSKPDQIQLFDSKQSDTRIVSPRQMKAHVILAADTIYSEEHPELLTKTILTWLAPHPDARVIVCYPLRMAYIDHIREFWQLMEAAELVCVEEGRENGDEEWNELAHTPYEWCMWGWKHASAEELN